MSSMLSEEVKSREGDSSTEEPVRELEAFPVEVVDIGSLKPHPRNYRIHPKDQIEHLKASILEHGLYRPIVTASDGTVLAGHGVILAAREMGLHRIPIRRLPLDPEDARALKLLAGDNEISHLGEVDDRALTLILKQIKEEDSTGLLGTGYDDKMLANLLFVTRPASEIADLDHAAEWVGMPDYEGPKPRLVLSLQFETEEERDAMIAQLGVHVTYKDQRNSATAWYPPRQRDDSISINWTTKQEGEASLLEGEVGHDQGE